MSPGRDLDPRHGPVLMPAAFDTQCGDCGADIPENAPVNWVCPRGERSIRLVCEACVRPYVIEHRYWAYGPAGH